MAVAFHLSRKLEHFIPQDIFHWQMMIPQNLFFFLTCSEKILPKIVTFH